MFSYALLQQHVAVQIIDIPVPGRGGGGGRGGQFLIDVVLREGAAL